MKRSTVVALLLVQSALIVVVGWGAVYLGRDEYLLATQPADAERPAADSNSKADDDGVPTVRLSAAAQRRAGINFKPLESAEIGAAVELPLTVLDPLPLAELHGRLQAARRDADAAKAVAAASRAEKRRVQSLYDDHQTASQRALEAATAQAATDDARERSAQASVAALRESARAAWGATVAAWLDAADGGPIARVVSGRELLLQASPRGDEPLNPKAALEVTWPGLKAPLTATPLGSAAAAAATPPTGRSLLYRLAASHDAGLALGMRVAGRLQSDGDAESGALVPASAIVWHAGQPWIYVRESGGKGGDDDDKKAGAAEASAPPKPAAAQASAPVTDAFQRRAVTLARRIDDRWFAPGLVEDDPVVTRGAQVLLSEELKFQLRNENDD